MCRAHRPAARAQSRDDGSATIWVLACIPLLVVVLLAVLLRCAAVTARHRAESAADLAALAGAGRIGTAEDVCAAARRWAAANGARLSRCVLSLAPDGRSGTVEVSILRSLRLPALGNRTVSASARAGRLRAPP